MVGSDWWGECFYAILLTMRKLRNFSTDRCYHLISRVANKAFYFTEEERGRFVERMRRVAYFTCVEVLAYCVMSNHFHILVYVPECRELNEEEILSHIRTLYTGARLVEILKEWNNIVALDLKSRKKEFLNRFTRRMWNSCVRYVIASKGRRVVK